MTGHALVIIRLKYKCKTLLSSELWDGHIQMIHLHRQGKNKKFNFRNW